MRDPRTGTELGPSAVIPVPTPAPPPPPNGGPVRVRTVAEVEVRTVAEIEQLTDELLTALHNYRVAKKVLVTRTAMLERRYGSTGGADIAGRDDYRKTKAEGACAWWRGEVMATSNALIALRGLTGGERP